MNFWNRAEGANNKLTLIITLVVGIGTAYNFILPYFHELPTQRLNRYDKAFKVYNRIVEAETDIDKKVLKNYGLELYHCNPDQFGTPKYSFIKVNGMLTEAEFSRTKQVWTYKDNTGHWTPIQTLSSNGKI